jgi:hypothetical protein
VSRHLLQRHLHHPSAPLSQRRRHPIAIILRNRLPAHHNPIGTDAHHDIGVVNGAPVTITGVK